MFPNTTRALYLAGMLAVAASGCSGLRPAWQDRFHRTVRVDSGPAVHSGTARLDDPSHHPDRLSTALPPVASPPLAPSVSPAAPALPAPADSPSPPADSPIDPVLAARDVLATLGARLTTDESGSLVAIDLADTPATDDTLRHLVQFPELRQLNLRATAITDVGLASLSELHRLEFLGLTGTGVTDAGLAELRGLTRLRFLTLGQTQVSDAGLPTLARMTQLEGLNLKGTKVTVGGAAGLQQRLPACKVIPPAGDGSANPDAGRSLRPIRPAPGVPPTDSDPMQLFDAVEERSAVPRTFPREAGRLNPVSPRRALEDPFRSDGVVPPSRAVEDLPAPADPQSRLMDILRHKLEDPAVLRAIADVYLAQDRPQDAVPLLAAVIARSPADRDVRFQLAVARARCGDYNAAHADFALLFGAAAADYNIGVLLFESGEREASIEWFERALWTDPQLWQARDWLAVLVPRTAPRERRESRSTVLSEEQIHGLLRELITSESFRSSGELPRMSPSAVGAAHESAGR